MRDDLEGSIGRHPAGRHLTEVQDDEAVTLANSHNRLNEWHHTVSTRPRPWWVKAIGQVVGLIALLVIVLGASILGEMHGGWPA